MLLTFFSIKGKNMCCWKHMTIIYENSAKTTIKEMSNKCKDINLKQLKLTSFDYI